jgi:tRNA(Arg) A34 adenosine deaminase TadA
VTEADTLYLRRAISMAQESRASGQRPFGALVVLDGEVLAEARSERPRDRDATAHSEMRVLRKASALHSQQALRQATLYASAEPCAMCAAAAYWTGVGRVVFGLSEAQLRAMTGNHPLNPTLDLPCRELFARGQRPIEVIGPCLEDEAAAPHQGYWNQR